MWLQLAGRDRPRQSSCYPLNPLCSPLGPTTTKELIHRATVFITNAVAAEVKRRGGRGVSPQPCHTRPRHTPPRHTPASSRKLL
ncbi:hypothetical protein E2C01_032936 [Portunus trituberculatus]|uniref:Uncharacterized protein n=1 Tax=Portunus trituberculatus TaxID=210409 RepID=A0A5B7EX81_PORTR|nr:hypothetical protein [Portunus trituberculatus]